jgi:hypothetical protein
MGFHTMGDVRRESTRSTWHELGLGTETLAQLPDNLYRAAAYGVGLNQSRLVPIESSAYLASENAASPAI